MELVLMPGIAHNLQPTLLLGQLSVNYHHWVGVGHRCDGLSSVQCLVIDDPQGGILIPGTRMFASVAKPTLSTGLGQW